MLHESIECVTASDGRAALARLEDEDFSAMLLDLLLPNMNGFEVLRHLRSSNAGFLERVIVITAASESTFRGCDELKLVRCVLRKPLDIEELIGHIRSCFENTRPADADDAPSHLTKRVPQDR